MARIVIRILLAVSGALALLIAARFWMDPALPAAQLGVQPIGGLGLATLRADMGGFFGAAGIFALAAAIRNDGRIALAPLVMIGLAISGRFVTLAANGFSQDMVMPIVVEAVLVALYATAWRVLR